MSRLQLCLMSDRGWKRNGEFGALARLAACLNSAVMGEHDLAGYRQSKPNPRPDTRDLIETIEHVRQLVGRNPGPIVRDTRDHEPASRLLTGYRNFAPRLSILDGIVQQVGEYLFQ